MTETGRAFRVLDLTTTLGGAYAAHLLSSGGIDVTRVDPPGGHALRRWSASGATAIRSAHRPPTTLARTPWSWSAAATANLSKCACKMPGGSRRPPTAA